MSPREFESMPMKNLPAVLAVALFVGASGLPAQTMRGSTSTMEYQNAIAKQHDFTFLRTSADVTRFVDLGLLVKLPGNQYYTLHDVSYPYARPAVRLFIERLSAQHYAACGDQLVVTSLTRPIVEQPNNASDLSVHPAGMAIDLRISRTTACRRWLEGVLLSLERQGVLDVTRERSPAHYHIAIYPNPYEHYVEELTGRPAEPTPAATPAAEVAVAAQDDATPATEANEVRHVVRRGESLWTIAQANDVTVAELRRLNDIGGSAIYPGQRLLVSEPAPIESVAVDPEPEPAQVESAEQLAAESDSDVEESAAPEASTSEVAAEPIDHRVERGESLWTIARANGTTVAELRRLNGLSGSSIQAGQTLQIPGDTGAQSATASEPSDEAHLELVDYRVKRGDSLWLIARRYGTSVDTLRELNDLAGSSIKAGQVISVPVGISSR